MPLGLKEKFWCEPRETGEFLEVSQREKKNRVEHTHDLRVSGSKAAGVVVDLLEDEAPVHEGETSLWTKQPITSSI